MCIWTWIWMISDTKTVIAGRRWFKNKKKGRLYFFQMAYQRESQSINVKNHNLSYKFCKYQSAGKNNIKFLQWGANLSNYNKVSNWQIKLHIGFSLISVHNLSKYAQKINILSKTTYFLLKGLADSCLLTSPRK